MGLILIVLGVIISGGGWITLLSGMNSFNGPSYLQALTIVQTVIVTGVVILVGGVIRFGMDKPTSANFPKAIDTSPREK
jgi:hypothetical protein